MTQNQYRQSVTSYYRRLAGHEQNAAQWEWERVLRGYITYTVMIDADRSN